MRLEILIGMIASGKSTYARHRADEGALVICHDDLTEMLHARYRYEADLRKLYRQCMAGIATLALDAGRDVVIDRTNLTRDARGYWVTFARDWSRYARNPAQVGAVVFPREAPEVHANRRTWMDSRGRTFKEWLKVAEHHAGQFEPVTLAEGFDSILTVSVADIERWAADPNPFPAWMPPRAQPEGTADGQ